MGGHSTKLASSFSSPASPSMSSPKWRFVIVLPVIVIGLKVPSWFSRSVSHDALQEDVEEIRRK